MAEDRWPDKDSDEVLDYSINWEDRLENGEAIQESAWIVPSPLVNVSDSIGGAVTTVWLSGGPSSNRRSYIVRNRITTSAGRTYEWPVKIKVGEI